MVRSLSQWTKTLSFPARISPNRNSKDCNVNVHPISQPPALPRKNRQSSPSPPPTNNVPITEISQIVSDVFNSTFRKKKFFYYCIFAAESEQVNES